MDAIQQARALYRQARFAEAEATCRAVLSNNPDHFDALFMLGAIQSQQGRPEQALLTLERAMHINPASTEALTALAGVLYALNRRSEALAQFDKILALKPTDIQARYNQGVLLTELERPEEALASYDRVLERKPNFEEALFNRANVLVDLSRYADAMASYDRVLTKNPFHIGAWNNRGNVLSKLRRTIDALICFERILSFKPDFLSALINRGNMLKELGRLPEALASYDRALAIDPNYVDALFNRGNTYLRLGQFEKAKVDLECVLRINPKHAQAINGLVICVASMCDWIKFADLREKLIPPAFDGKVEPFTLLNLDLDPATFLQCVRSYVRRKAPVTPEPLYRQTRKHKEKIRLAYFSSDFRVHPIGILIAQLMELHDRTRFDIIGVSTGEDDRSELRARLVRSFDQFLDVRTQGDYEVAQTLSELEVDIVVDLNGHTDDARPGVLALRPAPIQVNYLGFAGTTGAGFMDYVIADRTVVPFEQQSFYTEKIVHLPDCYLVNDATRFISQHMPTRSDVGLPVEGFVFCGFNNSYKISSTMFALWMRLLDDVGGSVLWLSQMNEGARDNLRREAGLCRVDPSRLIFAPRLPGLADHLARHRLADLFLDTLPFNAHSTACDALWAGLPVVTCLGRSFPSRVAASMLYAVNLPQLVTHSLDEYEALASKLARDMKELRSIRRKLDHNHLNCPLFDIVRFRRHIEEAYQTMWKTFQRGEGPRSFSVDSAPLAETTIR